MKHILFTLYDCDKNLLNDRIYIENVLYQTSVKCGATWLNTVSHQFTPQGVTAVTLLAESHISIHTWPEKQMAVCDIFVCGECDPTVGYEFMIGKFNAAKTVHHEYIRPFDDKPTVTLRKPNYPPPQSNPFSVIITE
jgi:S-adenosylmethionine decarboxylase